MPAATFDRFRHGQKGTIRTGYQAENGRGMARIASDALIEAFLKGQPHKSTIATILLGDKIQQLRS